ncbi:MAG: GNAT family protein [Nitrososphaerales archaeon]|jgi:RimJ/RimL family protein N-acetyltransferase
MLEGKNVNLKTMEKEDLQAYAEWCNNPEFFGEYNPLWQTSKAEMEKDFENSKDTKAFFIQKKDGSRIGIISHFYVSYPDGGTKHLEIGYSLAPGERGKGYGTEAFNLMLDYLFLSRANVRIQATTDTRNLASQRALEKAGLKKEGTLRKYFFMRGEWRDVFMYSILREEWEGPRALMS